MQNAIVESTGIILQVTEIIIDYIYTTDKSNFNKYRRYIENITLRSIEKLGDIVGYDTISIDVRNLQENLANLEELRKSDIVYKIDCSEIQPTPPTLLQLFIQDRLAFQNDGNGRGIFNVFIPSPLSSFLYTHARLIITRHHLSRGMIHFHYAKMASNFNDEIQVDHKDNTYTMNYTRVQVGDILFNQRLCKKLDSVGIDNYRVPPKVIIEHKSHRVRRQIVPIV